MTGMRAGRAGRMLRSGMGAGAVCVGAAVTGCGDGDPGTQPNGTERVQAVVVVSGLSSPVHLTAPPGDDRLFVVEQSGRIRIVRNGQLAAQPFLDLRASVLAGGERGLLSMAFHPEYAANGRFYVNYTDRSGHTRVERYRVSADPDVADAGSGTLVLQVNQPFSNHNGGLVAFGPDGRLYIGMGDGGSGGDPQNHGQTRGTLLGSLLRLDVDGAEPYEIPMDNPFRDEPGARPEAWAYGLRNPWRFSFDPPSGLLFIADVGQNAWEEVNAEPATAAGLNYGWRIMEASHCFGAATCDRSGLTEPVHEYGHSQGCSITGGHVYRGSALAGLQGTYFYSDYCRGWLRSFRMEGGRAVDHREWPIGSVGQVLSFGVDGADELYILSSNGRVYRLEPQ